MKSMKTYKEIPSLLSKALLGMLSEEEKRALQQWREESPENEQLYGSVMNTGYIVQKSREVANVDIVNGYMNVLQKRKRNVRVRRIRRIVSVAAGVVLPLLAVVLWYGTRQKSDVPEQVASVIRHGEVKAELVLADGTTRILSSGVTDSLFVQQGASIVVQDQGVSYQGDSSVVEERYNTLRVPRGGEYSITLSDGTIVYLNAESELRYPVKFVGEDRRVYLSGEAYFDVVHDKAHPFVVDVKNSTVVRVLGTSFDVRAYADEDEVLTTLVQGSVRFSAGKESVILEPGEQVVLDKSGRLETREVDTYLYTAWKDGVFAFKRQRLEEIMKVVARWYDVNVFWENVSQKEVTFTGKMKRYDDFSKVVEMLEMTGNTEFMIKENNIFIREK